MSYFAGVQSIKQLHMTRILIFFVLIAMLGSCQLNRREKAVREKEAKLLMKEQELLLKEKSLALKEEELNKRERLLDSTLVDSTLKYSAALPGLWNVKMECIETSCSGSAVGDVKSETWQFAFDSSLNLIANVVSGNNIARIYTGKFTGSVIELTQEVSESPSTPATKMNVRLNMIDAGTLEGQREIVRANDCKIVYSLRLDKQ